MRPFQKPRHSMIQRTRCAIEERTLQGGKVEMKQKPTMVAVVVVVFYAVAFLAAYIYVDHVWESLGLVFSDEGLPNWSFPAWLARLSNREGRVFRRLRRTVVAIPMFALLLITLAILKLVRIPLTKDDE